VATCSPRTTPKFLSTAPKLASGTAFARGTVHHKSVVCTKWKRPNGGWAPRAYMILQSEFRGERFRHACADHQHDRGALRP
jgi:hypothetical protein